MSEFLEETEAHPVDLIWVSGPSEMAAKILCGLWSLKTAFARLTWADLSRPATVDRLMRLALTRTSARRARLAGRG